MMKGVRVCEREIQNFDPNATDQNCKERNAASGGASEKEKLCRQEPMQNFS